MYCRARRVEVPAQKSVQRVRAGAPSLPRWRLELMPSSFSATGRGVRAGKYQLWRALHAGGGLLLRWIHRSGRIRASPSLQPTSRDRTCAGQTVSVSRHAGMGHRHGLGTPERLSVKHNHRLGTREDMGEQRTSKPWIYELPSLRAHGRSCYVHVVFTISDLPEQSRVHTCRPDLP